MVGRIIFCIASVVFLYSLFAPAVAVGDDKALSGLQAFYLTLRYGTANLLSPDSLSDFVVNFIALAACGANFIFVFWAMLVLTPTRITSLKWFWWISLLFILAAIYTGIQAVLSGQISLRYGYGLWLLALVLMLVAPVVSRYERKRRSRISLQKALTETGVV